MLICQSCRGIKTKANRKEVIVDNVLLSVIVPIYNVREYVEKCIISICDQTYRNLEIILVNRGILNEK